MIMYERAVSNSVHLDNQHTYRLMNVLIIGRIRSATDDLIDM